MTSTVVLTGADLDLRAIATVAAGARVEAHPEAVEQARRGHLAALAVARRREVYGHTPGVGAARTELAGSDDEHGIRLLRSHAAGWGERLPEPVVRAALAVRANQLLVGGSGATPELAVALAHAAGAPRGELPVVHRFGGVGTGDLTALAEVGLTLAGERPRVDGSHRRELDLSPNDALPLMSSNAFALAEAALHVGTLAQLARAADTVCALSFVALRGNPEAFSTTAAHATPHPGVERTATAVSRLVADQSGTPAHIQDFFGLRTWPQVHGALVDWVSNLTTVIETAVNNASENPVFTGTGDDAQVAHHGGFHAAYLALGLDTVLLALHRSASAVGSRVTHLLTDAGDLPLFLADPTPGSSGLLIAEYVAASTRTVIREAAASPSGVHTVTLSDGIEDDGSFAGMGAVRLGRAVQAYRRLVAVELLCAVRALRVGGADLTGPLAQALARCEELPDDPADHDLAPDLEAAERVVEGYAARPV